MAGPTTTSVLPLSLSNPSFKEPFGDGGGDDGVVMAAAMKGEEKLVEPVAVLDFDMLCATVALQTRGISVGKASSFLVMDGEEDGGGGEFGGVQRMWEGDVLDCFPDRRIAIEAACCPCYRFGKNMKRANLGSCFLQGFSYFILGIVALSNLIAFGITRRHCFLYVGVASIMAIGVYAGYFRTRIRKQFNIRASDSIIDDCMSHVFCPCCSLCQESRTLEMNNVQDGVWHGRGDTICIGDGSKALPGLHKSSILATGSPERCSMERTSNDSKHSWNTENNHSEPLVPTSQPAHQS